MTGTGWRQRLRPRLSAAAAMLVIALGALAGLVQLALPVLAAHPERVEAWLGERLQREVRISRLHARWVGGGPVLVLDGVELGPRPGDSARLRIPQAELGFDLVNAFRRGRVMLEFRVTGLDLRLVHTGAGWSLHGFGGEQSVDDFSLGALGAVELREVRLALEYGAHGLDLEIPVVRLLNRGRVTRVLARGRPAGSSAQPLDLVADLEPARQAVRVHVGGRRVDLGGLGLPQFPGLPQLRSGEGRVEAWLETAQGVPQTLHLQLDVRELRLAGPDLALDEDTAVVPVAGLARLAGVARWQRKAAGGWRVDVADLQVDDDSEYGWLSVEQGPDGLSAAGQGFGLRAPGDIAALVEQVPTALRRWLYLARPGARVRRLEYSEARSGARRLRASLGELRIAAVDMLPGFALGRAELIADHDTLLVELPGQATVLDHSRVFRRAFEFDRFGGDLLVQRQASGWLAGFSDIEFAAEDFAGDLRGELAWPEDGVPSFDVLAGVSRARVTASHRFWPVPVMPQAAVEWLDRGLAGGEVVAGRAAFRGTLADWPFDNQAGRFVARAEVVDAALDYDPDWPAATGLHAFPAFINEGMEIDAIAGNSRGVAIRRAHARISDLSGPVLELDAHGDGGGADLLAFLRASAIGAEFRESLAGLGVGGRGEVRLDMVLPLSHPEAVRVDGQVRLSGSALEYRAQDLRFTGASGLVAFDQDGVRVDGMALQLEEHPARLSLRIGAHADDPRNVFEAGLSGRFPASVLMARLDLPEALTARVAGRSEWDLTLAFPSGGGEGEGRLELASDLAGIEIDLPAPLAKPASLAMPLWLRLDLPLAGGSLEGRYGKRLAIRGSLAGPGQPLALALRAGGGLLPRTPEAGVQVEGVLDFLDPGAWLALVPAGEGSGRVPLQARLEVADLRLAGRSLRNTLVQLERSAAAHHLRLEGPDVSGRIRLPAGEAATVTADFSRLHWPDPAGEEGPAGPGALDEIDPATLPPLAIEVGDLRVGSARLGHVRVATRPDGGRMAITALETRSPELRMEGRGHWQGRGRGSRSGFELELAAGNLGSMLDSFGFQGLIAGGSTRVHLDASWPGAPSAFSLAAASGSLSLSIGEGRILDVEPGAGRLFGLLSLSEIPRRLGLDFSDFFRSGLAFNSIAGSFRLVEGDAWTDNLMIKSPAADISLVGRTGLRARDYDQTLEVVPHAGSTLPLVGALTGGPVGAAAGVVAQGLLSRPIGQAVSRRYHIGGTFDDPDVVPLQRDRAAPAREP